MFLPCKVVPDSLSIYKYVTDTMKQLQCFAFHCVIYLLTNYAIKHNSLFTSNFYNVFKYLILHPVIILIIFFCILKIFALCEEFTQNINP